MCNVQITNNTTQHKSEREKQMRHEKCMYTHIYLVVNSVINKKNTTGLRVNVISIKSEFEFTSVCLSSLQVITLSSSQSASPVTSTVPSATSTLQPLVKLESGSGPGLTGSRPMQKYIVVSLPSSASSSLENKSSVLPTSISSTPIEAGMKLDRSESPGASTQSPH